MILAQFLSIGGQSRISEALISVLGLICQLLVSSILQCLLLLPRDRLPSRYERKRVSQAVAYVNYGPLWLRYVVHFYLIIFVRLNLNFINSTSFES